MSHETARKNESTILNRLQSVGQKTVAERMGLTESTISKMKNKDNGEIHVHFNAIAEGLAVMGLKVVPESHRCFDPQKIETIIDMAKQYMANLDADKLEWEE